jgi:hypothetical protein
VVDLIVRRWAYIRIPVLILSVWGLIYMLGFLFGMLTRPHAIGPVGIQARYGPEIDIPLSWDDIDSWPRAGTASRTSNQGSVSTKMVRQRCICECRTRRISRYSSKDRSKFDYHRDPKRSARSTCTPMTPTPS